MSDGNAEAVELDVARARAGDRSALESVVRAIQKEVYQLALRFLGHPQDAEDATQEILIRIVTGLDGFRGKSAFRTWVYRVSCNALLSMGPRRMEQRPLSFEQFQEDLAHGLSNDSVNVEPRVEQALLLEEIKIGCTLAMLLCLDRNHRLAYVLGEIMELDQKEVAEILETSPATYRKRLSRARKDITSFMIARCGLVNGGNPCRCRRRVSTAVSLGRVDPANLRFASSLGQAKQFPKVLAEIRQLEEARRAAALYRSHPECAPSESFLSWLRELVPRPEASTDGL